MELKQTSITIFIRNADSIFAIDSLCKQNFSNWECFLINNAVKQISEYVANDTRFHVINTDKNITDLLDTANGEYIIIANSNDIFVGNALQNINRMIYLTEPDIVCTKSKHLNDINPDAEMFAQDDFSYIFQKDKIMQNMWENISCFCIKKEVLEKSAFNKSSHLWLLSILNNAKNMALSKQAHILCLSKAHIASNSSEYRDIIDSYTKGFLDSLDINQYFSVLIPSLVKDTIKSNDKETFVYCCKRIPLKLIPLKYKFMFFIMKLFN